MMDTIGFRHFAAREPRAPAIIEQQGRVLTRGELASGCNRLSRALRARDIRPGDVIAIMAPNCGDYLQVFMAAMQIGLHVVSINWNLARPEIEYVLSDSDTRALFVHETLSLQAHWVASARERAPQFLFGMGSIAGFESIAELSAGHSAEPLPDPVLGRVLSYTSATTGRPKGITLPLQDSAAAFERTARAFAACGMRPEHGNVHLCASMLYHAAPLEWSAMALHFGHPVVLVERWEPQLLLRLIDQHRVTTTFMVPTMFVRLLKLPADVRRQYSTASLRFVGHGGAPCPIEVKRQMIEWWGPVIWESYGSSEGSGTVVDSHAWLRFPGTVGRPFAGSSLKILNDEAQEVPPGTVGTIYLTRHTGDRFEYKGNPEKTRLAYRGELFTVGDMGYVNEEGYLFICDRKADMILCGGANIYPAEVEQVLIQHPQVADCMVFGIPDELSGEAIKAVVQPAPGIAPGPKLSLDILDFLAERLDALKLPRRIEYMEQLPRDPNGKAYKRALRDAHWKPGGRTI